MLYITLETSCQLLLAHIHLDTDYFHLLQLLHENINAERQSSVTVITSSLFPMCTK